MRGGQSRDIGYSAKLPRYFSTSRRIAQPRRHNGVLLAPRRKAKGLAQVSRQTELGWGHPGLLATPLRINGWVNWENAPAELSRSNYSFGAAFSWGMAAPGLLGWRFAGFTQDRVTLGYTQNNFLCRRASKRFTNIVPTAVPLGRGQGKAPSPAWRRAGDVGGWSSPEAVANARCSSQTCADVFPSQPGLKQVERGLPVNQLDNINPFSRL